MTPTGVPCRSDLALADVSGLVTVLRRPYDACLFEFQDEPSATMDGGLGAIAPAMQHLFDVLT